MPARQLLISVLLIVPFLGNPAHAREAYFGGNFALMNYATASLDPSIDIGSLYGKMGLRDERGIFRGELRLGFIDGEEDFMMDTMAMDDSNEPNATMEASATMEAPATLKASGTLIGAYALVGMPTESTVRPYAFLGYSLAGWTETICTAAGLGGRTMR